MVGTRRLRQLVLLLVLIPLVGVPATAARWKLGNLQEHAEKISPLLREEVAALQSHPHYDYPIPVIVQLREDVFRALGADGPNAMPLIHGFNSRLTGRAIRQLLESDLVEYVTLDAPLRSHGKPSGIPGNGPPGGDQSATTGLLTIGAHLAHEAGAKGAGINVAIFDSGIESHQDLDKGRRVKAVVDFTSGQAVETSSHDDDFGHGTHVAGTIGGSGKKSRGFYSGIAPKVRFVDLRVVGPDGSGQTSNLIKAIDWLIQNNETLHVQVANLSLGHPPVESYRNDPLGKAVARMVESGITTVVSAGNLGKTSTHPQIWGAISSPGNHPAVITVSATDTKDTLTHADDTAASYSSRGPTYVDGIFKPDLTAPGEDICSAKASNSWLSKKYPEQVNGKDYIYLSGSSMATAHVTGTVALMLSANSDLSPRMVKMILLATAVKLRQPHILEQGNGLVNAYTAVGLARSLDPLLRDLAILVSPSWELDGETVWAGGAVAVGNQIYYSRMVDASAPALWGSGVSWESHLALDGFYWTDGFFGTDSTIWDASVHSDESFWLDAFVWADRAVTNGSLSSSSVFWADAGISSQAFIWSDGFVWSDTIDAHDYSGDQ